MTHVDKLKLCKGDCPTSWLPQEVEANVPIQPEIESAAGPSVDELCEIFTLAPELTDEAVVDDPQDQTDGQTNLAEVEDHEKTDDDSDEAAEEEMTENEPTSLTEPSSSQPTTLTIGIDETVTVPKVLSPLERRPVRRRNRPTYLRDYQ